MGEEFDVIGQIVRFVQMPAYEQYRPVEFGAQRRDDGGNGTSPQAGSGDGARLLERARQRAQRRRSDKPPDGVGKGRLHAR
jgi:hypothetical protein